MIEEKMRSEFEAAAEEHFWLQDLRRDYDKAEQEYLDEIVQTAWEFWKLSREALQAEYEELRKDAALSGIPDSLPMEPYQTVDRGSPHYKAGWNACRRAMLAAASIAEITL